MILIMKIGIVLVSITVCTAEMQNLNFTQKKSEYVHKKPCVVDHQAVSTFRPAFGAFTANLLKTVQENYYMTISPLSVWITLAAIAEGTDKSTQKELFRLLNLPGNACERQKFYQIAVTRMTSSKYVNIFNKRILLTDPGVRINAYWYSLVKQYSLLRIVLAPLKQDTVAAIEISKYFMLKNYELNFSGNSILLNSMNYDGLWTTAFVDSVVERSPFYSETGQQIGYIDLMKMKKIARIGYLASMNAKILELPIGGDEEYRMIFALSADNNSNIEQMVSSFHNYTMFEVKESLQDSPFPLDVGIPRFLMKSEIDMKRFLEKMGVLNLWQNPGVTWSISSPPAMPTSYIQRNTLALKNEGIHPPPLNRPCQHSKENERYWDEFVADRPFIVLLVDAQTYTCLLVAMYSKPTYPLL